MAMPPACMRPDGQDHHVFVIGDWGGIIYGPHAKPIPADHTDNRFSSHRQFVKGADDVAQLNVAREMAKAAANRRVDYVLNVGDNFYWGGLQVQCGIPAFAHPRLTQWDAGFEGIYQGPGLDGKPWLGVLGNHDYGGFMFQAGWDQAIAYTWAGKEDGSSGRWITPAQYWSSQVEYQDFKVDYFFLDTNVFDAHNIVDDPWHNICSQEHNLKDVGCGVEGPASVADCPAWFQNVWDKQLHWLEDSLNKSSADWQIIVTHFPPDWGLDVWTRLVRTYGVDLFISGHKHVQTVYGPKDPWNLLPGTTILVSGGGGGITSEAVPDAAGHDDQYGFMDLKLSKETIEISAISHGGEVRTKTVMKPRPREDLEAEAQAKEKAEEEAAAAAEAAKEAAEAAASAALAEATAKAVAEAVAEDRAKAALLEPCFTPEVAYFPLDMTAEFPTQEEDQYACQRRCASTPNCVTFSYVTAIHHCHIQDAAASKLSPAVGFVSGRPNCTEDTTTTSTTTISTTGVASIVNDADRSATKDSCLWYQVAYMPLDMFGQPPTLEDDEYACQRRCKSTPSCETFGFSPASATCHLQDAFAVEARGFDGFVSGPAECVPGQHSRHGVLDRFAGCFQKNSARSPIDGFPPLHAEAVVESIVACQELCQGYDACDFWTFTGVDRVCRLATAHSRGEGGGVWAASGPKYCWERVLYSMILSNLDCSKLLADKTASDGLSALIADTVRSQLENEVEPEVSLACQPDEDSSIRVNISMYVSQRSSQFGAAATVFSSVAAANGKRDFATSLRERLVLAADLVPFRVLGALTALAASSAVAVERGQTEAEVRSTPATFPSPTLVSAEVATPSVLIEEEAAFPRTEQPRTWPPPVFLLPLLGAASAVLGAVALASLGRRLRPQMDGRTFEREELVDDAEEGFEEGEASEQDTSASPFQRPRLGQVHAAGGSRGYGQLPNRAEDAVA